MVDITYSSKNKKIMWLIFRNRILTKVNLTKEGWIGSTQCMFCDQQETVNHLSLNCPLIKQVWYWLGNNQLHYQQWRSLKHVFHFALALSKKERTAFLIVFSATCWTFWKHRNEVCFQAAQTNWNFDIFDHFFSFILDRAFKNKKEGQKSNTGVDSKRRCNGCYPFTSYFARCFSSLKTLLLRVLEDHIANAFPFCYAVLMQVTAYFGFSESVTVIFDI